MKEQIDIIIFSGQSNMQGASGEISTAIAPTCFEYRYLTDELVVLKDPVGEEIGDSYLLPNGSGTLVPAFCDAYAKRKNKVVALHCARGSTNISEWAVGTNRYNALIEKSRKGIAKAKEKFCVGKIYFVWLQGESDALLKKSEEYYLSALIALKNGLKKDLGIDKFGIIKVGYFAEYADWAPNANRYDDEVIMRAQDKAPKVDNDFIMLTDICTMLSEKSEYLNPNEFGPHYNDRALNLIGEYAAKTLAEYKVVK